MMPPSGWNKEILKKFFFFGDLGHFEMPFGSYPPPDGLSLRKVDCFFFFSDDQSYR